MKGSIRRSCQANPRKEAWSCGRQWGCTCRPEVGRGGAGVMSCPKPDPAGEPVRLSSPAPASVPPGHHEILRLVKRNAPTATSWARSEAYGIVEETIGKAPYQCGRSLRPNDKAKRELSDKLLRREISYTMHEHSRWSVRWGRSRRCGYPKVKKGTV